MPCEASASSDAIAAACIKRFNVHPQGGLRGGGETGGGGDKREVTAISARGVKRAKKKKRRKPNMVWHSDQALGVPSSHHLDPLLVSVRGGRGKRRRKRKVRQGAT